MNALEKTGLLTDFRSEMPWLKAVGLILIKPERKCYLRRGRIFSCGRIFWQVWPDHLDKNYKPEVHERVIIINSIRYRKADWPTVEVIIRLVKYKAKFLASSGLYSFSYLSSLLVYSVLYYSASCTRSSRSMDGHWTRMDDPIVPSSGFYFLKLCFIQV
jgi:hypothetical protein